MSAKHTPGPWRTVHLDQNKLDGNAPCCVKANNRTVAWVDFWQDESYATQLQMSEQAANASLIAAAPDLLEALLSCEQVLSATECSGIKQLFNGQVLDIARAAIAKAKKGEV